MNRLTDILIKKANPSLKDFQTKLIPETKYKILGVKTGDIKLIAKENYLTDDALIFLQSRHEYLDECLLHGFLIANIKEFSDCIRALDEFLPIIDNWAVCDSVCASLKIFKKNKDRLKEKIELWLKSDNVYTVRFAIITLIDYYAKDNADYIFDLIKTIDCGTYCIDMAIAWLYSVMLVYHKEKTITLLSQKSLPKFIQNKTIQKARESFRIDKDTKEQLKTLKI